MAFQIFRIGTALLLVYESNKLQVKSLNTIYSNSLGSWIRYLTWGKVNGSMSFYVPLTVHTTKWWYWANIKQRHYNVRFNIYNKKTKQNKRKDNHKLDLLLSREIYITITPLWRTCVSEQSQNKDQISVILYNVW